MPRFTRAAAVAIGAALAALLSPCMPARAQAPAYPSRPIRLVIPFGPGTGIDAIGRIFAQKLGADLGQPVVVENKAGASAIIGAEFVAKAPPDGHTLLFAAGTVFALNPVLFAKLPYDGVKSYSPISFIYSQPLVIATSLKVPATTLAEFVAHAREKQGTLTAGSLGAFHVLATHHFANMTKTRFTNVPYKNGTMVALIAGEIDMMFDVISLVAPQARAGKIRALGVASDKRVPIAPEIPTLAELGYPGIEVSTWTGMVGPAGMPPAIVDRIHAATVRVLQAPEMLEVAKGQGVGLASSTPEQLVEIIRSETARWQSVAQAAGITPQ